MKVKEYKNMLFQPLPIDLEGGNSISVGGRKPFSVTEEQESAQLRKYLGEKKVRFLREIVTEKIKEVPLKEVVQEESAKVVEIEESVILADDVPTIDTTVDKTDEVVEKAEEKNSNLLTKSEKKEELKEDEKKASRRNKKKKA